MYLEITDFTVSAPVLVTFFFFKKKKTNFSTSISRTILIFSNENLD